MIRKPTRDEVNSPERLFRFLTEMADEIRRGSSPGAAEKAISDPPPAAPNILDGVANGPAALVRLGIDQIATKRSNLTATVDPTTNDDSSQGYATGSFWVNTAAAPRRIFFLRDATVTAADWQQI